MKQTLGDVELNFRDDLSCVSAFSAAVAITFELYFLLR